MNDRVPPTEPSLYRSPLLSPTVYQVRISGQINDSWSDWFDGMTLSYDSATDETLLTGAFTDQSALHGLLAKLNDLQLNLVALYRLDGTNQT